MSNLIFRRAGPADAATVVAITNAAYAKWVPVIGRKPKPMLADYNAAIRDHLIEIADLDSKPVGLIELIPAADHLLLENIAIDPAVQGQGVGRRLMQRVEEYALEMACPWCGSTPTRPSPRISISTAAWVRRSSAKSLQGGIHRVFRQGSRQTGLNPASIWPDWNNPSFRKGGPR